MPDELCARGEAVITTGPIEAPRLTEEQTVPEGDAPVRPAYRARPGDRAAVTMTGGLPVL